MIGAQLAHTHAGKNGDFLEQKTLTQCYKAFHMLAQSDPKILKAMLQSNPTHAHTQTVILDFFQKRNLKKHVFFWKKREN